jgi:hypothetical protein
VKIAAGWKLARRLITAPYAHDEHHSVRALSSAQATLGVKPFRENFFYKRGKGSPVSGGGFFRGCLDLGWRSYRDR